MGKKGTSLNPEWGKKGTSLNPEWGKKGTFLNPEGEKMKENVKKYKILYSAIFIFFCFSGLVLCNNQIGISDEMFTFANLYKLLNGVQLYSQNNVIDTPLFFYLAKIFLNVFGANFFVYKIFAIIIFEIIFLLILNILRKLKIPTLRSIMYISLIILPIIKDLYTNGANYNTLAMLFWLLGMNFIIKQDGLKINVIQQGIVSALIFATKQNIGIYYLMGLSIFVIYEYRKEIKKIIKKLAGIYVIFAVITAIWVIWLAIQGKFNDFINYCFLGIGEFANHNISFIWEYMIFYLIPILTIIGLIVATKKYKIAKENEIIKITKFFLCFMLTSLLIGYPIFNTYHIELASLVSIIYSIYFFDVILIRKIQDVLKQKIIKRILIGYVILVLSLNIYYITIFTIQITSNTYQTTFDNPYFGMVATEEAKNKIDKVINFINVKQASNQDVIIFATEANIYRILLNQNYQDFDLPFLGNWGYNGEERVLNKIKNLKNTYILIKEEDYIGQESTKIKDYIKNNYNKTGEIEDLLIYYIE